MGQWLEMTKLWLDHVINKDNGKDIEQFFIFKFF